MVFFLAHFDLADLFVSGTAKLFGAGAGAFGILAGSLQEL
jgi:hypothetical protein